MIFRFEKRQTTSRARFTEAFSGRRRRGGTAPSPALRAFSGAPRQKRKSGKRKRHSVRSYFITRPLGAGAGRGKERTRRGDQETRNWERETRNEDKKTETEKRQRSPHEYEARVSLIIIRSGSRLFSAAHNKCSFSFRVSRLAGRTAERVFDDAAGRRPLTMPAACRPAVTRRAWHALRVAGPLICPAIIAAAAAAASAEEPVAFCSTTKKWRETKARQRSLLKLAADPESAAIRSLCSESGEKTTARSIEPAHPGRLLTLSVDCAHVGRRSLRCRLLLYSAFILRKLLKILIKDIVDFVLSPPPP